MQVFAGQTRGPRFAEADADEDRVELLFEFGEANVAADFRFSAGISRPAASPDRLRASRRPRASCTRRCRRYSGRREARCGRRSSRRSPTSRVRPRRRATRARSRCRRRVFPFGAPGVKQLNVAVEHVIDGVALQPADLNRLLALFVHHAGAFAKHFGGAHAPAAFAQNIRGKNHARGAAQIAGRNFLDERGNVDMRGAGNRARRVEAVKAPRGFDGGLPADSSAA